MSERDYLIWLNESTYIKIDFTTVRGRVTSFVVRLMLATDRGDLNIVRYDTAHGMPHRDLLDQRGRVVTKDWLLDMTFDEALTHAKDDFMRNYEKYIEAFEASQDSSGT